MGEKSDMWLLQ